MCKYVVNLPHPPLSARWRGLGTGGFRGLGGSSLEDGGMMRQTDSPDSRAFARGAVA